MKHKNPPILLALKRWLKKKRIKRKSCKRNLLQDFSPENEKKKQTSVILRGITAPFYNQNALLNRPALGKYELQHENH